MLKTKNKFESRVHIGLLLIIFSLLFLNFISNFTLYRARTAASEETFTRLRSAALSISRVVQDNFPIQLSENQINLLKNEYNLSGILIVPSRPEENTPEAKRRWLMAVVHGLPSEQIPEITEKILTSNYNSVTKGRGSEYFYVYPIPARAGRDLLVVSVNRDGLAYLDNSTNLILGVVVAALFMVTFLYLLISRTIFSPFRRIAEQAIKAGRPVSGGKDEMEALVADYEKMIRELQENKAELLKLNEANKNRADSLEEFNQYLLESINSGLVMLDRQGNILSLNKASEKILGTTAGEFVGRYYTELFKNESQLNQVLAAALGEGVISGYREFALTTEKGARRVLGLTVSMIRDHKQEPVGVSLLLNDLTELNLLREELETKHRLAALGEMAGGLAHQLRNSMGAIMGYGRLLKKKVENIGQSPESIDALVQETREAENLINQFLNFTRPFHCQPIECSFKELLRETVESFRVMESCKEIEFSLEDIPDINLSLDPLLIKQALANIIDNACNAYTGRRGAVRISARIESEALAVSIEDFGCGIQRDDIGKIFTPFFSSRPQGTGLGLPLAGKIIDLHGGRILLDSRPGQGTVFTVRLPLEESSERKLKASVTV
ncbi:MAG: PAS domain S-box protein [candidate division Zixibacteria bacterium]|nr:PAS domain S-box protein [candidate division Zixibacteria bacterium]